MNLTRAEEGREYSILRIETDDEELNSFLFSLGRCSVDNQLAKAIIIG